MCEMDVYAKYNRCVEWGSVQRTIDASMDICEMYNRCMK